MYTFSMRQQYDSAGVAVKPAGVVYAHAFGVVDAIDGADYQLVRIENPWGGGSDFLSEYSDGSEFWATHPELKRKADDSLASGGNFWIDWATFQKLCRHDAYDVAVPVS
jgi:hypothetical protein